MNLYKITFSNNVAVSADQIYNAPNITVQVENNNGHTEVKWLAVFADDERQGLRVANKVVKEYCAPLQIAS